MFNPCMCPWVCLSVTVYPPCWTFPKTGMALTLFSSALTCRDTTKSWMLFLHRLVQKEWKISQRHLLHCLLDSIILPAPRKKCTLPPVVPPREFSSCYDCTCLIIRCGCLLSCSYLEVCFHLWTLIRPLSIYCWERVQQQCVLTVDTMVCLSPSLPPSLCVCVYVCTCFFWNTLWHE